MEPSAEIRNQSKLEFKQFECVDPAWSMHFSKYPMVTTTELDKLNDYQEVIDFTLQYINDSKINI